MAGRGRGFRALQKKFRQKRFQEIERMIRRLLAEKERIEILDVGGRAKYWLMLPHDIRPRVKITCQNFSSELELYDVDEAGLEIRNVAGNACDMPEFADGQFDLVHSNSVIEHVGSYKNMILFADEVRRVGHAYYVQTPNWWFPVEPHYGVPFLHWLPDQLRMAIYANFTVGYAQKCTSYKKAMGRVDRIRLVDRTLLRHIFPDGRIVREPFLGLLTKSFSVIGGTACEAPGAAATGRVGQAAADA